MPNRLVVTITETPLGTQICTGDPDFQAQPGEKVKFVFPEHDTGSIEFRDGTPFATNPFQVGKTTVEMQVIPNARKGRYKYQVTWTDAGGGSGNGNGEIT